MPPLNEIDVYLETGQTRTIAGALDWPGWCRSGRDEQMALQALLRYGPRYAKVASLAGLEFTPPEQLESLAVVERVQGNSSTDYGVPNVPLAHDSQPVGEAELKRFQDLLQAGWQILDAAASRAKGKELRKGPRGGGRDLEQIVRHVWEAERGYLSRLNVKLTEDENNDPLEEQRRTRQAVLSALAQVARTGPPPPGPRGGLRWSARTFIRRDAWHVLDHAWEIEDRL